MKAALIVFVFFAVVIGASSVGAYDDMVMGDNGQQMGRVVVKTDNHRLVMDYDFDEPYDCRLTSIITRVHGMGGYMIEDRYPFTRDAQVYLPDQNSQAITSKLRFWCNDGERLARFSMRDFSIHTPTRSSSYWDREYYQSFKTTQPSEYLLREQNTNGEYWDGTYTHSFKTSSGWGTGIRDHEQEYSWAEQGK